MKSFSIAVLVGSLFVFTSVRAETPFERQAFELLLAEAGGLKGKNINTWVDHIPVNGLIAKGMLDFVHNRSKSMQKPVEIKCTPKAYYRACLAKFAHLNNRKYTMPAVLELHFNVKIDENEKLRIGRESVFYKFPAFTVPLFLGTVQERLALKLLIARSGELLGKDMNDLSKSESVDGLLAKGLLKFANNRFAESIKVKCDKEGACSVSFLQWTTKSGDYDGDSSTMHIDFKVATDAQGKLTIEPESIRYGYAG